MIVAGLTLDLGRADEGVTSFACERTDWSLVHHGLGSVADRFDHRSVINIPTDEPSEQVTHCDGCCLLLA